MSERFSILEIKDGDGNLTALVICDNKVSMSNRQAVDKLNDYEQMRLRKNKEIAKYKAREERYQRVISGVMAFLQLHLNSELWSDWND